MMKPGDVKIFLEKVYGTYHKRKYVTPDPLQFLYDYPDPLDREIVALIAAAFALGRVNAIVGVVRKILTRLPSPRQDLLKLKEKEFKPLFGDIVYRFYTSGKICHFLQGIQKVLQDYGTLENCFLSFYSSRDEHLQASLVPFYRALCSPSVLPDPAKKSASKRFHLFLRWMVRSDRVDPGGWRRIGKNQLLVPMDTHMYKITSLLGFTRRKSIDLLTVFEVTGAFRNYAPRDPVKYDFSLTRMGIHPGESYHQWFEEC